MNQMHQFKISLQGSDPLIWRRVVVPSPFTFHDLHRVIQALFGWENAHMHDFFSGKAYRSSKINRQCPLEQYFLRPNRKATYLYDFGDDWEHEIVFEKIVVPAGSLNHPTCLEGANAAPPEDCGGLWGYYDMLEAVRNPKHPEHETFLDWLGGDFDPKCFDMQSVNKQLARLNGKKRKSA